MRGKFIVIYGVNNLGKTTQAKLLAERLNRDGRKAKYLKFPAYNIEPSGAMIDEYLRTGNPYRLTAREVQILYAFNRSQYEPWLQADLQAGYDVVTEDYWGTGVAWGVGAGVEKDFMLRINKAALREDAALLFVGKRFDIGRENNHLHETDEALIQKVEQVHLRLASQFGWKIIDANQSLEKVSQDVWEEIKKNL